MRPILPVVLAALLGSTPAAQEPSACSCGTNPPPRPAQRTLTPYAGEPEDLRPYSRFVPPYYEHYTSLVEYNGAARDIPDPDPGSLSEIRIGFLAPLFNHPDQALGTRMLHGAQLAIDEANAAGGYCGKPFTLMLHNDSAVWGASSNEVAKMVYDEKVWAIVGSISGDTTHIALRMALKAETPVVNSASTDPTIPETIIPWYFTDIQDDRVQGYTLARHIYTELGLKRVALLRVNDRYGRFGVVKFRDASRRLGHPVVIEQKFQPGDTDFTRQLESIQDSRADAVVLWTDAAPAAAILKQMRALGMTQRVFGSHRTLAADLLRGAGTAAEGFEAVYPFDPTRRAGRWLEFTRRFEDRYHQTPEHFASLAYDAVQALLKSICRAGLNRGRIRDALTGMTQYAGVTGDMEFDPNCKNISPLFLGTVRGGRIEYRRITMEKPYARVGEGGVHYAGPSTVASDSREVRIAVIGPHAGEAVNAPEIAALVRALERDGRRLILSPISTEASWGQASTALVNAAYQQAALGIIALDRNSSHLAEQIGVKGFIPIVAISSDRTLTSANVPWIFRLPDGTSLAQAVRVFADAARAAGADRASVRAYLGSGNPGGGVRFSSGGEPR